MSLIGLLLIILGIIFLVWGSLILGIILIVLGLVLGGVGGRGTYW